MKKINKSKILIILLLVTVVLLSGCAAQPETKIKSQEEVQEVVSNVTENIGDIQETLEEIDQTFG